MKQIAILPLDDRPVNYDYPQILARSAGYATMVPTREWLGNPWRDSQHEKIIEWLRKVSNEVDALLLSIDTLAYGGLIRMRISHESFENICSHLQLVREIKATRPGLTIVASSVVQRVCRANSSEEEMPYWGTYGARMFRLSYLMHKYAFCEASQKEQAELDDLKVGIPAEVYTDYLGIRARNHAVNRRMIDWVDEGVLDYLLLPQDDTADYGWNTTEAHRLQAEIRRRGLTGRATTYPGADEIGCILLARLVGQWEGFSPRVYPRYSSSSSATIITEYEDRPMQELIKAHLAPLNGVVVDSAAEADFTLFVNAPAIRQGNAEDQWLIQTGLEKLRQILPTEFQAYADKLAVDESFRWTRREMETPLRSPEEFTRAIVSTVRAGIPAAIADVAFVNGADLILSGELTTHSEIAQLIGFGGWNTAGNTLGTVLAQAVIRLASLRRNPSADQTAAHLEFLFLRFLDDYSYQAVERTRCMIEDLPLLGIFPSEERLPDGELVQKMIASVDSRLQKQAECLSRPFIESGLLKSVGVSDVCLPWQRLFEIGCTVKVTL
ncbi:MAG: DUF4127 family protein [Anaerolineaceae bacterium]|nr:DUF4127 family protein [Anaerolineaceae bacterium]